MEDIKNFNKLEMTQCQIRAQQREFQRSFEKRMKRERSIEEIWCEKCQKFQPWHTFEMWNACSVCQQGVGFFSGDPATPACYRDEGKGNCTLVVVPYKINGRIHRK